MKPYYVGSRAVISTHRPECRDTSGTFTPFLVRTFESSLAKVHKITKKTRQNRSALLGRSNFTGKRLSLLVSIHMAYVEGMLLKQTRLFLRVWPFGKHYRFRPQM